jgi:hypothetical protein
VTVAYLDELGARACGEWVRGGAPLLRLRRNDGDGVGLDRRVAVRPGVRCARVAHQTPTGQREAPAMKVATM